MASLELTAMGQKLCEARNAAGLTQGQVAVVLGINQVQLSYYENGKREINLSLLEKLANLYGYDLKYFVSDLSQEEPETQLAFRADELCEEDLRTIAWGRTFLNNLEFMNRRVQGCGRL